jgi:hypothetical protein
VSKIDTEINDVDRLFCVSADIMNLGNAAPERHFQVRSQILTFINQLEVSVSEHFWFASDTPFPFRTPQACIELAYYEQNGDAMSSTHLRIRQNTLVDPNRTNNYQVDLMDVFSPEHRHTFETFRKETRVQEDGHAHHDDGSWRAEAFALIRCYRRVCRQRQARLEFTRSEVRTA